MTHGQEDNRRCQAGADDRGASLVEYALIFALLLVVSIGSFQYLKSGATSQADNQAACISRRPAPVECQVKPAIVPTTTLPITTTTRPTTTTTLVGATTTTTTIAATTTTLAPASVSGFALTKVTTPRGVRATLTLRSGSAPVANATVQLRFTVVAPGGSFETTIGCTTDSNGSCTNVQFTSPYTDVTAIKVKITSVQSDPAASGTFPAEQSVTFP